MPRLTSLKDLTRIREEAQNVRRLRVQTGTVIYIGMGTCGIAAGAADTLRALQTELAKRQIDASIQTVGCIGVCVKEPLVDIQQAGQPRITYANIVPEKVPQLIEEHLLQGRIVKEWVLGQLPVE